MIGRRVVVWGVTGSGKTTVARRLGAVLGLRLIELDAVYLRPGWREAPVIEFRQAVEEMLSKSARGWICDGNYHAQLGELSLAQSETVVWLRLPLRVTFWRTLKRTCRRAWSRRWPWADAGEPSQTPLFSHDSIRWLRASVGIVRWSIGHHRATSRETLALLAHVPQHVRVYELRSAREVEAFLDMITTSPPQPPLRKRRGGSGDRGDV